MIRMPATDDRAMWDVWLASLHLPTLLAADECGVFDALAQAPADAGSLAKTLDLQQGPLEMVMTLAASLDFVAVRGGVYHLQPAAREYLRKDSEFYWGGIFGFERMGSVQAPRIVAKLKGEAPPAPPGAPQGEQAPVEAWEQAKIEEAMARGIAAFMQSQSLPSAIGAAAALDLSGVRRLLDVGAGSGCLSIAFAQKNPSLRCTVMELESMCAVARDYIAAAGVQDRVDTITVDMFRSDWPAGYDAVFLSNVFHDWAADTNLDLAKRAFAALPSGGRIILHEQLLDDDKAGPLTVAAFSILMLLGARGRQYSFAELRSILEDAGFHDISLTPTYAYFSAITARKP